MPYVVLDRDPSEGPRPDGSTLVLRSEVRGRPRVAAEPSLREIEAAPRAWRLLRLPSVCVSYYR